MEVTQLPAEGIRSVDTFSVAAIEGATSFGALLEAFQRVEAGQRDPGGRHFVTLDDLSQCLYTSGHARDAHDLDAGVAYPDEDGPEARAAYDKALFQAGAAALRDPARTATWESVCGALATAPGDIDALAAVNQNPDFAAGSRHIVQRLPTDDAADLLANIPNGYFTADLNPFQCHAVARRLSARHSYALFGIGASTLGFRRATNPTERDTAALIADLQALYGEPESAAWATLAAALRESPVLLLGYTEDFAELVE